MLSLLIVGLLISISAQFTLTQLSFELNRDYIAKYLCIEKDVKNSSCNGSCHLKKTLEKQKEKDNPFSENEFRPIQIQLFFADINLTSSEFFIEADLNFPQQKAKPSHGYQRIDDQPPCSAVFVS